ncbi:hypothetical protein SDRG_07554 [Saprolegnia diclina VS20]|uniref:THO complex subunit 7 n=1 Tax=Saprolegnia diclina (strain VS20) TaxID=1156394 RepID=T0QJ40_SAPDV|nr:hypothetical protein SDRG_07554 [Saprolegnia diclina VS20]EQC34741.1 hypothetical protein SDRG_07554 [Saprolegnia diclina VS20]|eukprot:XP_008611613.1 hypothetical protein SDRG_07554 [Saprolegnia diclina VS20]
MDEEEVIRQRLLTRSSVLGSKHGTKRTAESMLKFLGVTGSLGVHYSHFTRTPAKKPRTDASIAKKLLDEFLWDLELVEADAVKCELLMHTCDQELSAYNALHAEIDQSVLAVTQDIDRLKGIVADEKLIRSYKEEYEAKARDINKLPSKAASEAVIEGLEDQLRQSTDALTSVSDRVERRAKDFALLMRAIRDLQCMHKEEAAADAAPDDADVDDKDKDKDDDDVAYEKESKQRSRHVKDAANVGTPPPSASDDENEKTDE